MKTVVNGCVIEGTPAEIAEVLKAMGSNNYVPTTNYLSFDSSVESTPVQCAIPTDSNGYQRNAADKISGKAYRTVKPKNGLCEFVNCIEDETGSPVYRFKNKIYTKNKRNPNMAYKALKTALKTICHEISVENGIDDILKIGKFHFTSDEGKTVEYNAFYVSPEYVDDVLDKMPKEVTPKMQADEYKRLIESN